VVLHFTERRSNSLSMTPRHSLALALDPTLILHAGGLTPDAWQRHFLASTEWQVLLNCCRQAGKSTGVSAFALHAILFSPGSLVLIRSPSQRQSGEMRARRSLGQAWVDQEYNCLFTAKEGIVYLSD
jgi:hypothetical protein